MIGRRTKRAAITAILLLGLLPLVHSPTQPAFAATFTVTRTGDPSPDGCRQNDCSLREAVIAANNRSGPDVIKLPAGRYEITRATSGEDNSQMGDLDILKNVTVDGAGRGRTIIDGNRHDRIFHIGPLVDDAVIRDVALVRGSVEGAQSPEGGGGGVLNQGRLRLANVRLENNRVQVEGFGGGIFNQRRLTVFNSRVVDNVAGGGADGGGISTTSGRLTINESRVDHNRALGSFGAGVHISENSTSRIVRSKVDHNRAPGICCGGGLYIADSELEVLRSRFNANFLSGCCGAGMMIDDARVVVRKSFFKNNLIDTGCCGGGILAQGSDPEVVIRDTIIAGNSVKGCCGAGFMLQGGTIGSAKVIDSIVRRNEVVTGCCGGGLANQGGVLTVIGTRVHGNSSINNGGGIHIQAPGQTLVMKRSTVSGNSAGNYGGGVSILVGSGEIINSTISGNTAEAAGGGVADETSGSLSLTHVTLTENEADDPGGGIYTDGGAWTVLRSIVANNSDDCNTTLAGPTGKNLDKDSTCFNTGIPIHAGPRLRALRDNGGKTPTHLPRRTSPAVDEVGGANCGEPGRDQRGVKRPQNGDGQPGKTCDLGAVERKPGE